MKELEMYEVEKVAGGDLFGQTLSGVAGTVNTAVISTNGKLDFNININGEIGGSVANDLTNVVTSDIAYLF